MWLFCRVLNWTWTHFPLKKMADISQKMFLMNFHECKVLYFIKISLKCVPRVLIDNNPALVYIMTWRRIGDKPFSEPMLIYFTDVYMRHKGEMCFNQYALFRFGGHHTGFATLVRDYFLNAPRQWEATLHCNAFSHWLGPFTKWPLLARCNCAIASLPVMPSWRL